MLKLALYIIMSWRRKKCALVKKVTKIMLFINDIHFGYYSSNEKLYRSQILDLNWLEIKIWFSLPIFFLLEKKSLKFQIKKIINS